MRSLPLTIALCVTIAVPAVAQVPSRMPIQGTLYDLDGEPVDGVLPVDFTLYADPDGTEGLWSDTSSRSPARPSQERFVSASSQL